MAADGDRAAAHEVRIKLGPGSTWSEEHPTRVELDGIDLTACLNGVSLKAGVGTCHTLVLELDVLTAEVDGEAAVEVPEWTRSALLALGWSPPE